MLRHEAGPALPHYRTGASSLHDVELHDIEGIDDDPAAATRRVPSARDLDRDGVRARGQAAGRVDDRLSLLARSVGVDRPLKRAVQVDLRDPAPDRLEPYPADPGPDEGEAGRADGIG